MRGFLKRYHHKDRCEICSPACHVGNGACDSEGSIYRFKCKHSGKAGAYPAAYPGRALYKEEKTVFCGRGDRCRACSMGRDQSSGRVRQ